MSPGSIETADLSAIESRLSDSTPFGSYGYISENVSAVYIELLTLIAKQSSAAAKVLHMLGHVDDGCREVVFRDSLVRRTIEDGVCRIVQGIDTIEPTTLDELLWATAENLVTVRRTLLNNAASCVPFRHRAHGNGYIWVDDQPSALPGRRFEQEILKRLPGFRIEIPTEDQIQTLVAGERLASQVAPTLARSAISHVFMVVVGEFQGGEHRFHALTMPGLPGLVVLSPKALSSNVDMAETLLHESMHLKFLDIDYIHPLFAPGFRQESSPRITPVWHQDKAGYGNWPIDRLLTSMHVYLALAVFFGNAGNRVGEELYAPDDCAERAAGCKTRATWLFEAAQNYLEFLTAAGREFVASIGMMLAELDA